MSILQVVLSAKLFFYKAAGVGKKLLLLQAISKPCVSVAEIRFNYSSDFQRVHIFCNASSVTFVRMI
jgi:hypothetical protein